MLIKGNFEPDLKPLGFYKDVQDMGRMSIDKVFEGVMVGSSVGEMLSCMGQEEGNAGYVAIEKFSGSVDGKKGSFALMHYGRMDAGADSLLLEVVPGTGTEELTGISGSMTIDTADGRHSYQLDYNLD